MTKVLSKKFNFQKFTATLPHISGEAFVQGVSDAVVDVWEVAVKGEIRAFSASRSTQNCFWSHVLPVLKCQKACVRS